MFARRGIVKIAFTVSAPIPLKKALLKFFKLRKLYRR